MNTQHTPGPWTRDHGIVRDECGTQIALVAWDIEANARLIASAPDLLAALKDLVAAAGSIPRIFFHDGGLEQRVVGAHRKARDAIAKAEE